MSGNAAARETAHFPTLSLMDPPQGGESTDLRAAFDRLAASYRHHSGRHVMVTEEVWRDDYTSPSYGPAPSKAAIVARAKEIRVTHEALWDRECAVALGRLLRAGAEYEAQVKRI